MASILIAVLLLTGCAGLRLGGGARPQVTGERLIWFSTYANLSRLKDAEAVNAIFKKCADVGLTGVVVDIETKGYLTFPSERGTHFSKKKDWPFAKDYDLLKVAVEAAHRHGLKCYVTYFGTHQYSSNKDWQFVHFKDILEGQQGVNPFLPHVKAHYFDLVQQVITKYDVDGLILDGIRFRGHDTDFSQWMREGFEDFLGEPVENWPQSVLTFRPISQHNSQVVPGPLYREWSHFRASLVKDYIKGLRKVVKRIKPDLVYADYVGAWYPDYAPMGANWASTKYRAGYDWMSDNYHTTGYAEQLDLLAVGLYYDRVTVGEARAVPTKDYYSVEGAALLANEVVAGAVPLLGTLYIIQYQDNPEQFKKAVQMALRKTDGLGIFDAVYIAQYDWWDELKEAIEQATSPQVQ